MSERSDVLMGSVGQRIRSSGYSCLSFREIAVDAGVKSSSVHHDSPTKGALAATRRYAARLEQAVSVKEAGGAGRIAAWRRVFRRALLEDGRMCFCGALSATA